MTRSTRRTFLRQSLAAMATITIAGTKSSGKVLGSNEAIRVGVCGIHGQGNAHIDQYLGFPDAHVTYLIDPDQSLYESRSKKVTDKGLAAPTCVQDLRQALEDKNLDAISIAAPNHWHSLATIWSCQAGKDVYVEKPLSHELVEGRRCVEAARKYQRIVQHGTQQRSNRNKANEIAAVQSGKYGKLLVSKGYCCKPRWSIGFKPVSDPPPDLDFNLWLGPAAERPFHRNLVHYNWHWNWDFGNGDIGNQGIHELDVARWGIKNATFPTRVWSLGGRLGFEDQGQTPNMQMAVYEYGDVLLIFEVRGLVKNQDENPENPFSRFKVENEFYTTEGMIARGMFYPSNGGASEKLADFGVKLTDGGSWGSFLHTIRSRKPEDNNADVEVAHHSCSLIHTANISYRLGEKVKFDASTQKLGDNREVVQTFENLRDNLRVAGVKLEETTYQLGRTLQFDPKTERFIGEYAQEANALLTRDYRKPFVVPEQV